MLLDRADPADRLRTSSSFGDPWGASRSWLGPFGISRSRAIAAMVVAVVLVAPFFAAFKYSELGRRDARLGRGRRGRGAHGHPAGPGVDGRLDGRRRARRRSPASSSVRSPSPGLTARRISRRSALSRRRSSAASTRPVARLSAACSSVSSSRWPPATRTSSRSSVAVRRRRRVRRDADRAACAAERTVRDEGAGPCLSRPGRPALPCATRGGGSSSWSSCSRCRCMSAISGCSSGCSYLPPSIGAIGLNMLTGTTGQLSLAHAFFLAVGAYGYAYCRRQVRRAGRRSGDRGKARV